MKGSRTQSSEPEGVDDLAHRGADGVLEDASVFNLASGFVDEGVLDEQGDRTPGRAKGSTSGTVWLRQSRHTVQAASRKKEWKASCGRVPSGLAVGIMPVMVRRTGQRTEPVAIGRKRSNEGRSGSGQQGLPEHRSDHQDRPRAGWSGAQSTSRKRGFRG